MAESSLRKLLRINPFWAYRDPASGRWLTLMTAAQCQRAAAEDAFAPKIRRHHHQGDHTASPPAPPPESDA